MSTTQHPANLHGAEARPAALLPAPTPTPWQGPGVVCAMAEQDGQAAWVVNADTGSFTARVAASCLLQPQVGDTVWCCGIVGEGEVARYWVTQVLERIESAGARVLLPADATLASADGRMSLHAQALQVRSQRMDVLVEQASVIGAAWEAVVGAVKLTGNSLRSVFERVTHTAQHHQRVTSGIDLVQAEVLDLRAGQLASVQGEHVIVQGERLIKSRAAQIHMG